MRLFTRPSDGTSKEMTEMKDKTKQKILEALTAFEKGYTSGWGGYENQYINPSEWPNLTDLEKARVWDRLCVTLRRISQAITEEGEN